MLPIYIYIYVNIYIYIYIYIYTHIHIHVQRSYLPVVVNEDGYHQISVCALFILTVINIWNNLHYIIFCISIGYRFHITCYGVK